MTVPRYRLLLFLPLALAMGCGQKGPIYLPGHEPPSMRTHGAKQPAPSEPSQTPTPKDQEPDQN